MLVRAQLNCSSLDKLHTLDSEAFCVEEFLGEDGAEGLGDDGAQDLGDDGAVAVVDLHGLWRPIGPE